LAAAFFRFGAVTSSFSLKAGRKVTVLLALILRGLPVCGLRPVRAGRLFKKPELLFLLDCRLDRVENQFGNLRGRFLRQIGFGRARADLFDKLRLGHYTILLSKWITMSTWLQSVAAIQHNTVAADHPPPHAQTTRVAQLAMTLL
jgi:hypothetical protein